jgi:probable HAF family extracellular repeat protein
LEARCLLSYSVIDLTPPGAIDTYAEGINSAGQVTGYVDTADARYAFLYDRTASPPIRNLGTLGGASTGLGINDFAQVTGNSTVGTSNAWHAFLYNGNATPAMRDLGTLGGRESYALGINDSGQVAGSSDTLSGAYHAFLYDPTATPQMQDLGTLGGSQSTGTAINASGQVVGYSNPLTNDNWHAFLYDPTGTPQMRDLGTLGPSSPSSWANGVNASGQVVGRAETSTSQHAFLYDPTATPQMRDLGTLGGASSDAVGINDSGQVVGSADTPNAGHAFLYDPTATPQMQDLNDLIPPGLGWVLEWATAINDNGQIVVNGRSTPNGPVHAFLLSPAEAPGITSASSTTFTVGTAGTFTVTTTGLPTAAIGVSGALPGGVAFIDNGDGTASLAGTPAAGSGGVYHLTVVAGNQGGAATQQFALTINEAPAVTSASSATFLAGVAGSFTVTTFGFPFPVLGASGPVPEGLVFTDNGDGTASLAGTAEQDSAGIYDLVILAANSLGYATQHLTVTVNEAPAPHAGTGRAAFLDPTLADAMAWAADALPLVHRRVGSDGLAWFELG